MHEPEVAVAGHPARDDQRAPCRHQVLDHHHIRQCKKIPSSRRLKKIQQTKILHVSF
jgi:hypothetical protein